MGTGSMRRTFDLLLLGFPRYKKPGERDQHHAQHPIYKHSPSVFLYDLSIFD